MKNYTGLIKSRYPNLTGRDWINQLTPDDKAFLIRVGLAAAGYGRSGGRARAASALRDSRGRFTTNKKG